MINNKTHRILVHNNQNKFLTKDVIQDWCHFILNNTRQDNTQKINIVLDCDDTELCLELINIILSNLDRQSYRDYIQSNTRCYVSTKHYPNLIEILVTFNTPMISSTTCLVNVCRFTLDRIVQCSISTITW